MNPPRMRAEPGHGLAHGRDNPWPCQTRIFTLVNLTRVKMFAGHKTLATTQQQRKLAA